MKRPKIDQLAHSCLRCGVGVGVKCTNYLGKGKQPCQDRGRPHIAEGKLKRKAEELTRKAVDSYGPLFGYLAAEEVKPVTPADLAEKRRRGAVAAAEHTWITFPEVSGLEWVRLWAIRRHAAKLIGEEWAETLWAYCERTYGSGHEKYFEITFTECLTTTAAKNLAYELRFDRNRVNTYNSDGRYLVATKTWPPEGYRPVATRDELKALFPPVIRGNDQGEVDDDGLFEGVMNQLSGCKA